MERQLAVEDEIIVEGGALSMHPEGIVNPYAQSGLATTTSRAERTSRRIRRHRIQDREHETDVLSVTRGLRDLKDADQ